MSQMARSFLSRPHLLKSVPLPNYIKTEARPLLRKSLEDVSETNSTIRIMNNKESLFVTSKTRMH